MKVAIVHDYLHTYGGGERVLELFHDIYPDAPIYTIMYVPSALPEIYRTWDIRTTFLNRIPLKKKLVKYMTPLMPLAVESLDLSEYDLVISITAGFAKGVITSLDTCHISYTLTVPRFLWGYETSTQVKHKKHVLLPFVNTYLRLWDKAASDRVDAYIANSQTVKGRIAKAYGRDALVVYSPVDEEQFSLSTIQRENYYVIVSRLEPYKRVDLAIQAALQGKFKLYIIGEGSERQNLEKLKGESENIEFLGRVDDETVMRYYKSAKAVIFPGADDLGLVPIEAQMCGTPVIAYKRDGALETVQDGISGVLFAEQDVDALMDAIVKLDSLNLNPTHIRETALPFAKSSVKQKLQESISHIYEEYMKSYKRHG